MDNIAIKVEALGKKYVINHENAQKDDNFREMVVGTTKKIFKKINPLIKTEVLLKGGIEEFWALNNVDFEINKGDKVGIIGRNGAGKSTLLKVLSRITEPTTGKIHINGRIASLLEVGTGFHPELTGRENIYLNGAILGMTRKEIKAKFDEIVAFAEIEKFLDTPVKRYSSGMYVRLAFSVAAHLEPEILVVDEVLAVGDVEFQKKCLGKMQDVSEEGRTILFVSHNMAAIEHLCNKGIILNKGSVEYQSDNIKDVISKYLKISSTEFTSVWKNDGTYKHNAFTPKSFFLTTLNDNNILSSSISNDQTIVVNIEFEVKEVHPALAIGYKLYSASNELIYITNTTDDKPENWPVIKQGHNLIQSSIPARFLNEGEYRIELICSLNNIERIIEAEKDNIKVFFSIKGGLSDSPYWLVNREGVLAPVMSWKVLEA